MMEEMAMIFGSRIIATEDVYPMEIEYRLHRIETRMENDEAVASIYDGDQEIHREFGKELHTAIALAKAWIDEQDEQVDKYDLHVAA